jgi:hypothetical protein
MDENMLVQEAIREVSEGKVSQRRVNKKKGGDRHVSKGSFFNALLVVGTR